MRTEDQTPGVTKLQVLCTIYDSTSINIIGLVHNDSQTPETIMKKLNITLKQYSVRISKLLKAGLVKRKSKKYSITSFGKIVYDAYSKIARAAINLSTLKVMDTIKLNKNISHDEYRNVIEYLISDNQLKNILLH